MKLGGEYLGDDKLAGLGFRRLGRDVRIHSLASLYGLENISIGDHVRIDDFAVIIATGPVVIGNYVHIANFCYLGATQGITLEDFSGLSPGVMIFTSSDDYSGTRLTNPTVPKKYTGGRAGQVILGKHVILGARSVVLPQCHLGEGCSVGAMSLVNRDLEPWGVYSGIPARRMKERKKDLLELERQLKAEP